MNLPAKPLPNANVQRLIKPCTCHESLLDLNLKNQQQLPPESDSDAQELCCEHPAGRSLFWIERDKNYDWEHKPVRQFDCRTEYQTVWLTPETRLTDLVSIPNQNNERSFWMNRSNSVSIFLVFGVLRLLFCFSSNIEVFLCLFVCLFELNLYLWEICKDKKDYRFKWSKNCVCRIIVINNHK